MANKCYRDLQMWRDLQKPETDLSGFSTLIGDRIDDNSSFT